MIRIGQPAATLETPVEHLMACHRRIEDRLATLERAADYLEKDREAALQAIRKSMDFLESSGAQHTRDEEESLFPRLRPQLTAEDLAYLDSLEEQHRAAADAFERLKRMVDELNGTPEFSADLRDRYREAAAQLGGIYRAHIRSEDEILTSMAKSVLTTQQLDSISREMRERRR